MTENPVIYDVPTLEENDILYIAAFHSPSEDLQLAMAFAMEINCSIPFILDFIRKFGSRFPRILPYLLANSNPKADLSTHLFPLLTSHIQMHCDDSCAAYHMMSIICETNRIDAAISILPILLGSLWSNPYSGIALAHYCISKEKHMDALTFLNAATFVGEWRKNTLPITINRRITKPKNALPNIPSQNERELHLEPLIGIRADFMSTLRRLFAVLGSAVFSSMQKSFTANKVTLPKASEGGADFSIASFHEEDAYLYDPGVEIDSVVLPAQLVLLPL
jgi:hypothetical protein